MYSHTRSRSESLRILDHQRIFYTFPVTTFAPLNLLDNIKKQLRFPQQINFITKRYLFLFVIKLLYQMAVLILIHLNIYVCMTNILSNKKIYKINSFKYYAYLMSYDFGKIHSLDKFFNLI